jgi:hypothetical protein
MVTVLNGPTLIYMLGSCRSACRGDGPRPAQGSGPSQHVPDEDYVVRHLGHVEKMCFQAGYQDAGFLAFWTSTVLSQTFSTLSITNFFGLSLKT